MTPRQLLASVVADVPSVAPEQPAFCGRSDGASLAAVPVRYSDESPDVIVWMIR